MLSLASTSLAFHRTECPLWHLISGMRVRRLARYTESCIVEPGMRQVAWLGSSRKDVAAFPDDARRRAGYELYLVQTGVEPSDWKPMPGVRFGVQEIRIHTKLEHRVMYVTRPEEAIYVLHAFEKKTRKTVKDDVELARSRLRELLNARRAAGKTRKRK